MPNLKHLLLLSCIGLSPACIDVPPLDDPPKEDPRSTPDADFTFTATPAQEQVLPGGTLDCGVQLAWTEAAGGAVTWNLVSPPAGIELQAYTLPQGETRATLSIRVGAGTVPGAYTLTLQGKSGSVTKQATLTVTVGKPGDLVVNWVVPTPGKAYTRGPLLLQFTVEGGAAEQVEILKDSTVLVKPTGSPYSFTWDTTSEAEGTYQLSIRATRGGAVFTSAPRTIIVDRTAPTVASFLPAKDAATVGVHESIRVTFSEPMNPLSVTEAAVGLKTGAGVAIPKSVSVSADGQVLTVTPNEPLAAPDTISVDLTTLVSNITDLAGNGVQTAPTWKFTVPSWLPLGGAISAVAGRTSAEDVILKVDREGRPVIAWSESDGSTRNIYVAKWSGAAWDMLGAPLSGLIALGTDAARPDLAIDASNRPVVVWDEATGNGEGRDVFARRWTGSTWTSLPYIPLVSSSQEYALRPQLVVGANEDLFFHATQHDGNNSKVRGFKLPSTGSAWIDLNPVHPTGHLNADSISVAAAGNSIFTAYSVYDDTASRRGVAVLANDASLLGGTTLGTDARVLSVAVDTTQRPWVSWVQSPAQAETDGMLYWARWEASGWSTPTLVSNNSTGNNSPSLALGAGTPHVLAWSGVAASERSILVSRWIDNSWKPMGLPISALTASGTPAFGPSVSMDANGQPVIAWTEADATSANVHVFRLNY
ncbi:Ig-like domain-containing protein [Corallococcus sp. AS-1-6]|uniref:Ig-like domain-containing protein n=1 Tax=Corallococcus sp. AS-1-6 TaxID=2874599 RepID=UPI001CC07B81|nr:Ig-like domain-containing protein [Corallococcus sp. AS-1-6]MBZ4373517.1 Ig-like domain-containing protein [Corallococcus sp. AS-1-6]